jgi:hypothetical protein
VTRGVAIAALALLWPVAARAQLVDESFESGGLDAGGWTQDNTVAGITVFVSPAAAHRGLYGLRMQDSEVATKGHAGTYIGRGVGQLTPAVYSRLWARFGAWDGGNGINLFDLSAIRGSVYGADYSFGTDSQGNVFWVSQPVDDGGVIGYAALDTPVAIADGAWHLLEGFAWGIGTGDMSAAAYVDGVDAGQLGGLVDLPDAPPRVLLGELWAAAGGTGNFVGTVDYDDVRVNDRPLPGRLGLVTSATPRAGDCFSVTAELLATAPLPDGGPAGPLDAPYDVTAFVDGGSFFRDAFCRQSLVMQTTLGAGTSSGPLFVQAQAAGPLTLTIAQDSPPDFLPGTLSVTVAPNPDAGSDAGAPDAGLPAADGGPGDRSLYALSCGCGTAPPTEIAFLIVLGLLTSRYRGRIGSDNN